MRNRLILAPVVLGAMLLAGAAATSARAETVVFTATLAGAEEPKGGDPDGSGSFRASVETSDGDVCYTLAVANLPPVIAAHVHDGGNNKPVINLDVTGPGDEYCLAAQLELLKAMAANPGGYYVNVHTKDFPAGAIRGDLVGPAGATPPAPAAAPPAEPAVAAPAASSPAEPVTPAG